MRVCAGNWGTRAFTAEQSLQSNRRFLKNQYFFRFIFFMSALPTGTYVYKDHTQCPLKSEAGVGVSEPTSRGAENGT